MHAMIMRRARRKPGFFSRADRPPPLNQQELLHLQVTAIFLVTFLIVIASPPFLVNENRANKSNKEQFSHKNHIKHEKFQ